MAHASQTTLAGREPVGTVLTSSSTLHVVRRLDWRFLLPDPSLGRVAYLGPSRPALLESLNLFSSALTVIETTSADSAPASNFDVVVASGPSNRQLDQARMLLKAGGFIYVEAGWLLAVRGLRSLLAAGSRRELVPLRFANDYAARLEKRGFTDVQIHWHLPEFESCTKIIPAADAVTLLQPFLRRQGGTRWWLKTQGMRGLTGTHLLRWLVPCFSLMARKE